MTVQLEYRRGKKIPSRPSNPKQNSSYRKLAEKLIERRPQRKKIICFEETDLSRVRGKTEVAELASLQCSTKNGTNRDQGL